MTDTKKSLFKLTPQSEGAFYTLRKLVNDEKNLYAEIREYSKQATVTVKDIYKDTMLDKFTLTVDRNQPLEILYENVVEMSDTDFWESVDVFVNQRRAGEEYRQSSHEVETYQESLENYGYDDDRVSEDGWEKVGFRVVIAHGDVEIEKVSEEDGE